jgi:hypothetical protein
VKVVAGESAITPDTVVEFEQVHRIPAAFRLKRQHDIDEALAKIKPGQNIDSSMKINSVNLITIKKYL